MNTSKICIMTFVLFFAACSDTEDAKNNGVGGNTDLGTTDAGSDMVASNNGIIIHGECETDEDCRLSYSGDSERADSLTWPLDPTVLTCEAHSVFGLIQCQECETTSDCPEGYVCSTLSSKFCGIPGPPADMGPDGGVADMGTD